MNVKKYSYLNILSLSFVMHFVFAFFIFALVPKSEKFTTIELQSGAIGVKSLGMSGPVSAGEKIQPKASLVKTPVVQKISKNALPKSFTATEVAPSSGESASGNSGAAQVGSGTGSGATGSGNGSGKDTPLSRYVQKVVTLIENHKSYPSRARTLGQQGTVSLKIKLDHAGKLLEMDILDAPPYKILVNAAKDTISSIGNFPSMPEDVTLETLTMNVPIRYELVE